MSQHIEVEQEKGLDFRTYAEPIETATSIACAMTAEPTGNPQYRELLSIVGRMYGRIIYLLDSYRDYPADVKNQSFNPLTQNLSGSSLKRKAEELFNAAYTELKASLELVQFVRPEPCTALLSANLGVVAAGIFSGSTADDYSFEGNRSKHLGAGWCDGGGCDCCCDFDFCQCGGDGCCDCNCDC
jgi:hypothetical protein